MAKPLLDDQLWALIEPLLPPPRPRRFRYPGRKPVGHRQALTGILFVLKTGISWEDLPRELGCGCGMTCWSRLRDWTEAGVWERVEQVLRSRLNEADRIDWSRAVVEPGRVRGAVGGARPAPTSRLRTRGAPSRAG
jgi:transposase